MWSFKKKKSEIITSYMVLFYLVFYIYIMVFFFGNGHSFIKNTNFYLFKTILNKRKVGQSCVKKLYLYHF
jgi:hypothetical protein